MDVVFLDNGLIGKGEHSFTLIREVGDALSRRGVGWTAYGARGMDPKVAQELGAVPHFSHSLYESVGASANEWRLMRAAAFLTARRFDPNLPTERASARVMNRAFAQDILALPERAFGPGRLVALPGVAQHQLPGLVEALLATTPERRPRVLCQLMFAPDWTPWGTPGRLGPRLYARAFKKARPLIGKTLFFGAENAAIAGLYRAAYGVEAALLPVPFGGAEKARQVPARPCFAFFGYSKADKGFHLLPEAIAICRARGLDADFLVQIQHGGWEASTVAAEKALRALDGVRLIEGVLDEAAYAAAAHEADAMLLPYDPTLFGLRGSGIFTQATAAGRPVVASAGAFAAAAVAAGEAEGEVFSPYDAKAFADAIMRLAARMPTAHKKAAALAADFARRHTPDAYADVLLAHAGGL